jgi:site-specific recombinase XerD
MNEQLNNYKEFLIARKLSLNYYNSMRIFFHYLEEQKIEPLNITQETITKFINANPQYKKNTLNQFITSGTHMYREFFQLTDDKNEWTKISYYKEHKNTPKFLSYDELQELIKYFRTYENRLIPHHKVDVFFTFIYMTGLRRAEIINLKRSDIDLNAEPAQIRVVGKGDKERFIFFSKKYSPKLKEKIIEYFSSEPENTNAFNITKWELIYMFKKMNKYLKDRKITPHLMRHSFGRYLVDKGVPITYISSMLGHSSIITTMRYISPLQDQIKRFMK